MHDNHKHAAKAPRCHHTLADGRRCSQPALHRRQFCRFHDLALNATRGCQFPFIDSAEALQVALTQIVSAMADGSMDQRKGQLCLYGLNLASANLHRLVKERKAE